MEIPKIYLKKSLSQLKAIAVRHCHKYIRDRDKNKPCISCGKYTELQAGHFYSAGQFSALKFTETNIWGQCKKCNYFLSGNLLNYRNNLIDRIGMDEFLKLEELKDIYKRSRFKWDRFSLIKVILKYKKLNATKRSD